MSLINTEVQPFKAQAFHNGKFVEVTEASLKGKWSVVIFYPADFTFVCPTELDDVADHYAEFQKTGRRGLQRLDRHPLHAQGLARHLADRRQDQVPDGRRPDPRPDPQLRRA